MNRTIMLALTLVFLALTMTLPVYIIIDSWNQDIKGIADRGPMIMWDETDIQSYFQETTTRHQNTLTILVIVEIVFGALFILSFGKLLRSYAPTETRQDRSTPTPPAHT